MRTIAVALGLGLMLASPLAASEQSANPAAFDIPAGTLADALDVFGEQSGLQVVYDHGLVDGKRAAPIAGAMPPQEALERLVAGAGLDWELVNGNTVALRRGVAKDAEDGSPPGPFGPMPPALPALEHVVVVGDPRRVLPGEPSSASLGFAKPLLETPRSVSVISQETIDLFGLSAVEDLVRVVPGVYTPTRFGIQGSVDVRGVPADTYFRGMKRLNLQGHARSVLAATDVIEIVRGPPAPIYGMGKIGGYTNVLPKSSRAANGAYLDETHGFARAIRGAYGRDELSFGLGGPLELREQPAGYYVYSLLERSGSYAEQVPIAQDLLQVAFTADDFVGPFRLETGVNYQRSVTAGALLNRVTQALVDDGRYVRGSPLVDLDANGNGKIGYLEMHAGSPVAGALGEENLPLRQWWSWPTDAAGEPLALGEFPIVPGIPQSMYDYLVAHPDADPGGLLRAQGVGGPAPISGHVPIGMVLDPRTVEAGVLDARRTGAFERELEAEFVVAFFDLVYDEDPGFTVKNQLFLDSMDQYKLSEQPGGGKQDVRVIEDKLTVTRRLRRAPEWLDANALASANARATRATGYRYGGDFGSHRTDAMSGDGRMTANTTFAHPFENDSLERDGAPWTSNYRSDYWELGVGAMLDLDILERTNVLVGARFDRSRAKNVEYAGTLDPLVGSAAQPGALRAADRRARRYDSGVSWHASVSRRMRGGLRPYVTVAESSLTLESNNNRMPNGVIEHGHIGSARLREIGLKGAWLGGKMFFATALYEQSRIGVVEDEDPAILEAEASATTAQGWETELKWVPSPSFALSVYALRHRTRFEPNRGAALLVDARALGFADVLDAEGNVVYPAEAFLYGGRSFLVLPDGIERYALKQGNPESQFGLTVQYRRPGGLGFTLGANVFSSVHAGRLQIVRLPGARVLNAGMFWEADRWHVQLDLLNALDEHYFRARTGDTLSDTLVSAMPPRNWQLTAQLKF